MHIPNFRLDSRYVIGYAGSGKIPGEQYNQATPVFETVYGQIGRL